MNIKNVFIIIYNQHRRGVWNGYKNRIDQQDYATNLTQNQNSVNNPNSMHGIYPYRGKISAIDAESIINQLPQKGTFLDPFCGSGTIVYEAQKHGLKAYGIDNNPLAIKIAKAKIYRDSKSYLEDINNIIERAKKDLKEKNYKKMPEGVLKLFHNETADEIMCIKNYYNEMDDYLIGIFFGTIALAARGCNDYMWTSTTVGKNIEPKRYIDFFEKFEKKAKKHAKYFNNNNLPDATIIKGDSRNLTNYIENKSIDFVLTSPPYFDCLDYTAYYGKIIYEIFEVDRNDIKKDLIQHVDTYKEDMRQVIEELDRITTDNAIIIFVVGDKKIGKNIINGGEFFNSIKEASYIEERSYSGSSSQVFDVLNKTNRKEQIVVWNKEKGKVVKYGRKET